MNLKAARIPEDHLPESLRSQGVALRSDLSHPISLQALATQMLRDTFAGALSFSGPTGSVVHAVILHEDGADATVLYDEDAFMACQPVRTTQAFMPAPGDWRPRGTETDSGYLIADPTPGARTVVHTGVAPALPDPFDFWSSLFGPSPRIAVKEPEARDCGNPDCPICWPYGRF